jgi:hypothetical protein
MQIDSPPRLTLAVYRLIGPFPCVLLALVPIVVMHIAVHHVLWRKHEQIWMEQVVVSIVC